MRDDEAFSLASEIVAELGPRLLVPDPVVVEVDHLLRSRTGHPAARAFLRSVTRGEISIHCMTPGLVRRAVEIDSRYADLGLGYADASVMAVAERMDAPILTFDFEHFRASSPMKGFWRLVVDEDRYAREVGK